VNHWQRFGLFSLVGFSGMFVNAATMWLLHGLGVQYLAAAVVATQVAIGWNLLLSEQLVFRDRLLGTTMLNRFTKYYVVNNIDLLLRMPIMVLLVEVVGMRPAPANLLLVMVASAFKYVVVNRMIYGTRWDVPLEEGEEGMVGVSDGGDRRAAAGSVHLDDLERLDDARLSRKHRHNDSVPVIGTS